MGKALTEEQMEFACDFTKSRVSFSDPGTGKTQTLIAGIIMAQIYHKVPGASINCMSFTKMATAEISARYKAACKHVVAPTANFSTLHAFNYAMLRDAFPGMQAVDHESITDVVESLSAMIEEIGLNASDKNWVRKVHKAINDLNSSLCFHPESIVRKYSFVETGLSVENFQHLRKKWFMRGAIKNRIVQGDIPLYCLYALMKRENVDKKWRNRYEIMIIDEFQDLSLLSLQIMSRVAKTLIAIGDMNQQIYAFNGACPQIVKEYFRIYPDAETCNLTKSFRCSDKIAKFSATIVQPNVPNYVPFEGHDMDSEIVVESRKNIDWKALMERIRIDVEKNRLGGARDIMFLYRNNASAVPIIEGLYKENIPFRCTRLKTIMEIPIFDCLCTLANAAWQPNDYKYVLKALKLFPEFKNEIGYDIPPADLVRKTGKSLFDLNYKYSERSSYDILNAMLIARKKISEQKNASIVLNNLMEVYDKYIIKGQYWRLDNTKEFYFDLIAPICSKKDYPTMIEEELDKQKVNDNCMKVDMGIRCYTMHSAKGLEADDVYILDCNDGIFPNSKAFKRKVEAGCVLDAATDVRQDRNLLYVAITRAKYNVYVIYDDGVLTPLVATPNDTPYSEYDDIYNNSKVDFDDASEFYRLFSSRG